MTTNPPISFKDLSEPAPYKMFTALVESVLLYGSETWTMTKRLEKMVDT